MGSFAIRRIDSPADHPVTARGAGALRCHGADLVDIRPEADQQRKMLSGLVFALLMLPAASALCWVFMLDRDTLAGAVRDPESSIEGKWYEKAVFGAFHDLFALCGLGAMALGLLRIDVEPVMLLVGVVLLAAVDVLVRYLVIKKVEG